MAVSRSNLGKNDRMYMYVLALRRVICIGMRVKVECVFVYLFVLCACLRRRKVFQVISVSLNWEAERPPRCDEEGSVRSRQKWERENVLKECFSIPSGRKGFKKWRENEESFYLQRFGPLTVILINSDGAMYSTYERSTGFLDLQSDVLIQSTSLFKCAKRSPNTVTEW